MIYEKYKNTNLAGKTEIKQCIYKFDLNKTTYFL